MKSLIEIDDTWTEGTFYNLVENGHTILQYNQLPNRMCPFDTLRTQQRKDLDVGLNVPYDEYSQMQAVYQHLNDEHKARVLANMSELDWRIYQTTGIINGELQVPAELVTERTPVDTDMREELSHCSSISQMQKILTLPHKYEIPASGGSTQGVGVTGWLWNPRGDVIFAANGEAMEIPAWPDSVKDNISVSWSQEMTTINHYEPVQTYRQTGPRTVSCSFKLHRAMWDGNQDSGYCEKLVAFMESCVYPDYSLQAAEPPECTLIVGSSIQINGILTSFDKSYQGPIGPDNKYDEIIISISITEVSQNVLDFTSVRNGLSGVR